MKALVDCDHWLDRQVRVLTKKDNKPTIRNTTACMGADIALHGNPIRATGRHLPYGITQCYLPPDTSDRAPPNPSHAGWHSIYLPRRDGMLSWPSWFDSAPARSQTSYTFRSRVRRRTAASPRHNCAADCVKMFYTAQPSPLFTIKWLQKTIKNTTNKQTNKQTERH